MLERIKKVLRHNQLLAVALVIVIVLGAWLVGCHSTVRSPFNPDRRVTRPQLLLEWDKYAGEVQLAIEDLDRQDLFKQKLTQLSIAFAQGGTIDPLGAGITLLGILGLGAVGDNLKKDSIIKTMQNGQKSA